MILVRKLSAICKLNVNETKRVKQLTISFDYMFNKPSGNLGR